jgi:predicted phosphodiesterase
MVKSLEDRLAEIKDKYSTITNSEEYRLVQKLQKEGLDPTSIMNIANASKRSIHQEDGFYEISNNHTKILVFGDTHIGNKGYDPKIMNTAAKVAKDENVDILVCTGDMADGWYQNRPAEIFEQDAIGFDNQLEKSVKELSKLCDTGKPLYFITGNHEYNTFVRGAGVEFGKILKLRLDTKGFENYYLGNAEGNLKLDNTRIKLIHPDGGTAYAISYKSQKIIESLQGSGERLPDVALIGHFHKSEYIPYQGVHTFQTGTFCDQTKFMRGKGIPAHKGFWVIDIFSKDNGKIDKISPTYYPFK